MTTNVVLPVFVADASLTSDGVDLASFVVDAALAVRQLPDFVADAALDATTQLDLAVPVINNTTVARSLALPQIEPVPDGIRVTLPAVTVDMTEPYGNKTVQLCQRFKHQSQFHSQVPRLLRISAG